MRSDSSTHAHKHVWLINWGGCRRPVRLDPLATQTFDIVKDAIFQGMFLPGQQLREMQLAKHLNISQATVREALAQLEQVGLVVRSPTRRITVTSFSRDEIRDRLAMRVVLEEMAGVRAAERLNKQRACFVGRGSIAGSALRPAGH